MKIFWTLGLTMLLAVGTWGFIGDTLTFANSRPKNKTLAKLWSFFKRRD